MLLVNLQKGQLGGKVDLDRIVKNYTDVFAPL